MGDSCFTTPCWFLPCIHMNQLQVHIHPLPLDPPSHSLGCHRALGLSSPLHTVNSHWLSISHMVMCLFPSCSLHSFHPLPHQVHKTILCLHLHCCPANRMLETLIGTKTFLLNSWASGGAWWGGPQIPLSLEEDSYSGGDTFIDVIRQSSDLFTPYGKLWTVEAKSSS